MYSKYKLTVFANCLILSFTHHYSLLTILLSECGTRSLHRKLPSDRRPEERKRKQQKVYSSFAKIHIYSKITPNKQVYLELLKKYI